MSLAARQALQHGKVRTYLSDLQLLDVVKMGDALSLRTIGNVIPTYKAIQIRAIGSCSCCQLNMTSLNCVRLNSPIGSCSDREARPPRLVRI